MLAAYERHLVLERDVAPHTVRAYLSDLADLFEHLTRLGCRSIDGLDIGMLRSWLAKQQTLGKARTTIARRATAVRVFTAWARHTGLLTTDPGALLGSPKPHRTLPAVLDVGEVRGMLDVAQALVGADDPVALRDVAVLELLYASGIRVGELVALDVDDLDPARRVVRVFGKGRKERMAPYGVPAGAGDQSLARPRPRGAVPPGQRRGALPRDARRAARPARRADPRPSPARRRTRRPGHRSARASALGGDASARRRCRPASGPGDPRSRLAGHHPALHARHDRAAAVGLPAGASASLTPRETSRGCGSRPTEGKGGWLPGSPRAASTEPAGPRAGSVGRGSWLRAWRRGGGRRPAGSASAPARGVR